MAAKKGSSSKKAPKKRAPKKKAAKKPSRFVDIFRFDSEPEEVEVVEAGVEIEERVPLGAADTSDNERQPARDHTPAPSHPPIVAKPKPEVKPEPPAPMPVAKVVSTEERRHEYALERRKACRQILRHRFLREPIPGPLRNLDDLALTNRRRIAHVRDAMRRDRAKIDRLDEYIAREIPLE